MSIFKSFTSIILIGIAAISLTVSSARAATLIVDSGQLIGAQNVDLGSLGFFDVTFMDGTCVALFDGCDDALADFDFTTEADALTAAQALLDQVFIDVAGLGSFDSSPGLTFGCSNSLVCQTLIPFELGFHMNTTIPAFNGAIVSNFNPSIADSFGVVNGFITQSDTSIFDSGQLNFARFTVVTAIPLPPAALLFGTALLGLAGLRRRRRQV